MSTVLDFEYNGRTYFNDGNGWYDENKSVPPPCLIPRLNAMLEDRYSIIVKEPNANDLLKMASSAEKSLDYQYAEGLVRRSIEISPGNFAAHSKLCSILRRQKKPEQALAETEPFRNPKNYALLISRAAAYVDLKKWEEARREISIVLKSGNPEFRRYAFAVVQMIKRGNPDIYTKNTSS